MDWTTIATFAAVFAVIGACVQTWTSWKQHEREEQKRLREQAALRSWLPRPASAPSPAPLPSFPSTYTGQTANQDNLASDVGADYTQLRNYLAKQLWKSADQETTRLMLWVAGVQGGEIGWRRLITEEDIFQFPRTDLRTIDRLWVKYSNGKFGFSVQKQIWRKCGSPRDPICGDDRFSDDFINMEKFEHRVGWMKWNKSVYYSDLSFSLERSRTGELPHGTATFGTADWLRNFWFYETVEGKSRRIG